jgi:hypothetical protein
MSWPRSLIAGMMAFTNDRPKASGVVQICKVLLATLSTCCAHAACQGWNKQLIEENAWLKRLMAELNLDEAGLQDVLSKRSFCPRL